MVLEMSSPISQVVVLCWETPSKSDRNAFGISTFLGAETTFVSLSEAAVGDAGLLGKSVPKCACLIVDVETLAKYGGMLRGGVNGLASFNDLAANVFIYGFQSTDCHAAILRALSDGGLAGVQPLSGGDANFNVTGSAREWCGQFSGLSFGTVDPSRERCFLESNADQPLNVLVRAGQKPFFLHGSKGGSQTFFLASSELADLGEKVQRGASLFSWFSRLAPLMMFLRGALGNRLWHNETPRACFIVDDPLLRSRYGFLEYERLTESMRKCGFSTCVAFIPWNFQRSKKNVADFFSSDRGALCLCIHGCDHTRAEFASTQFELLRAKAKLALERMRAHQQLSGVPFDDVMVFPQGLFSAEAIKALKAAGYLAAVNTDPFPSTGPNPLVLRDLLEVAVTEFDDFPLFCRRYPHDVAGFAFDLFLGKPVLAVEHHGYFRNGYGSLEGFVERLNNIEENLQWTNLGTICSRASLTRTAENGDIHVRFYTGRFSLTNTQLQTQRFVLFPPRTADEKLLSIAIDGREWEREQDNGQLKIPLSLGAGQTAEIKISPEESEFAGVSWRGTHTHQAKVRIRRFLSELRDNYVDTSRVLSAILQKTRKLRGAAKLQTEPLNDA